MTFLSLFAGIGGMDLGLERAGMTCIGQVEIDPYCRKVLEKHWPHVWRHDDVRTLTARMLPETPDLICGGFPCQDISNAGKRAGIDGAQSGLWREFYRLVCEIRPRFVLVENVAALLVRGIERVLGDLAKIGMDAEWESLPAGAFGSHHLRDRVFIASSRADAFSLRPRGEWKAKKESWSGEQFERLVQTEIQISVPSGSSGGISHGVPNRKHRLRALGNAVVPQVAEWIGRRIVESVNNHALNNPAQSKGGNAAQPGNVVRPVGE